MSFYGTYIELGSLGVCLKYSINILYLLFDVVVKIYNQRGIGVDGKGVMVQFIHSSIVGHLGCFHWIPPIQFISVMSKFLYNYYLLRLWSEKNKNQGS